VFFESCLVVCKLDGIGVFYPFNTKILVLEEHFVLECFLDLFNVDLSLMVIVGVPL